MKVLFVANQFGHFRHMEPVAEALLSAGHQIEWRFGNAEKNNITDRSVINFNIKHNLGGYQKMPVIRNIWRPINDFVRGLLGYRVYLFPGLTSPKYKNNYLRGVNWLVRMSLKIPGIEDILLSSKTFAVLRHILRILPCHRAILLDLKNINPDVLIVTSNLPWAARELEYLVAANLLDIPSAIQVASWDNLTTKSTFDVIPDAVLLWNDALKEEAEVLHGIPSEKIIITGAATFDYIFAFVSLNTHFEFCQKVGLRGDAPFIVYLGSSRSIAGDETEFAKKFVQHVNEKLGIQVLIRPHPINYKIWGDFHEPGSAIWPQNGELPDTSDTKQDFLETLYHSLAVVGVNTSAIIESAILDKPCVVIKSKQFESAQSETGHFRHLSRGQFLEIAEDIDEAIFFLRDILKGNDQLQGKRKVFVSNFIRPKGMEKPVGVFIAETLIAMAK